MKKQAGFTLIELVVVMVILGILAAVALPKFVDMTKDARIAKLQGALGAVNSAMALTHAASLVAGSASSATSTVTAEGTSIAMVYGYPAVTSIVSAAGINPSGSSDYIVAVNTTVNTYIDATTVASSTCRITYTPATSSAAATATMDKSAC